MPNQYCTICEQLIETADLTQLYKNYRGQTMMMNAADRVVHKVISEKQTAFWIQTGRIGCRPKKDVQPKTETAQAAAIENPAQEAEGRTPNGNN
jgi:hypothetical protein